LYPIVPLTALALAVTNALTIDEESENLTADPVETNNALLAIIIPLDAYVRPEALIHELDPENMVLCNI